MKISKMKQYLNLTKKFIMTWAVTAFFLRIMIFKKNKIPKSQPLNPYLHPFTLSTDEKQPLPSILYPVILSGVEGQPLTYIVSS